MGGRGPQSDLPAHARVAVMGGGIVGLACAHYLAGSGVDGVVVLERGRLMHEASAANGGGLWPGQQAHGAGVFHDLARGSLDLIQSFAAEAGCDLELRPLGVLDLALGRDEAEVLRAKTAVRRASGLGVEWLEAAEARAMEPALASDQVHGAAWYPDDHHINPARLGAAFARSALQHGARLVTGAAVRGVEAAGPLTRLYTDRGSIEVTHVVVTTGAWAREAGSFLGVEVPVEPAKGQLLATAPQPPLLRHAVINRFGVIQTSSGHVIMGGSVEFLGFDAEPTEAMRTQIRDFACTLVPALAGAPVSHSWARFRPHTPDELPLIGFCGSGDRHLIAAGHYKNGLLLSAVSGRIIADLLTCGETRFPLAAVDPHRFTPTPEGTLKAPG